MSFCRLVCEKFSELTSGNPTLAKRKVLAGIVMTNENDLEDMKVCTEYYYIYEFKVAT